MNQQRPPYTAEEDAALRRLFATATRAEILAAIPNRGWHDLQKAASRRGLSRPRRKHNAKWEGRLIELLHARYPKEGAMKLAAELELEPSCIRAKAAAEGLRYRAAGRRPAKKGRKRTSPEDRATRAARVKKLYPNRSAKPKAGISEIADKPAPPSTPTPTITTHDPRPKAKNTLRPMQVGAKPDAPRPAKGSLKTPNLNARVAARVHAAQAQAEKPKLYVTAEQLRAAPQSVRWAYTCAANKGPAAATAAFHEAMKHVA